MTGFVYLADQVEIKQSLNSTPLSATTNGSAVDLAPYEGAVLVDISGPAASTADTADYTIEHSEDGSTSWAAVAATELVVPSTGVQSTFPQHTAAAAYKQTLALKRERLRRYIRVVATLAGGTISIPVSASIIAQKKDY